MNIPKDVIDKKSIKKNNLFYEKWIFKDKNLQQSRHLKF
jgi:hypothetical protein